MTHYTRASLNRTIARHLPRHLNIFASDLETEGMRGSHVVVIENGSPTDGMAVFAERSHDKALGAALRMAAQYMERRTGVAVLRGVN